MPPEPQCLEAGPPKSPPRQLQSMSCASVLRFKNPQHKRLAIELIELLGRYAVQPSQEETSGGVGRELAGVVLSELKRVPEFRRAFEDEEFRGFLSEILSPAELIECAALLERAIAERAAALGRPLEEVEATQVARSVGVSEVKLSAIKELVWGSSVSAGFKSSQHLDE